ncbi:class E sortase [Streptomyces varsoviensis]|uniref:class E sortase n=1 Tax=Streptomyces varsoviensis TaxID=67373 RepID=UPI0033F96994
MTALRPEREGAAQDAQEPAAPSGPYGPYGPYDPYEDTGAFAAAVELLDDPLTDPLPGRPAPPPARQEPGGRETARGPEPRPHHQRAPEPVRAPDPVRAPGPVRPHAPVRAYEAASGTVRPQEPPTRRSTTQPQSQPQPLPTERPAERQGSPWFRPHAPNEPHGTHGSHGPHGPHGPHEQPTTAAPRPVPQPAPQSPPPPPPDGGTLTLDLGPDFAAAAAPATATGAEAGDGPRPEGRAARRKAAQEAAKRSGRGRRTAPPAAGPAGAPAAPRTRLEARRAARARKESPGVIVSRLLGEGFITIGVLMLLFVTYQLWWTNVIAHQQAGGAANSLQHKWDEGGGEDRSAGAFSPGQGFAIIYIPKLDVKAPIAEGISKPKVLDHGMVGHYADGALKTAMPWDKKGNFALAGHRNTHGEPFRYINQLKPGDKIVVETKSAYYTYEMTSALPQTAPSNTGVIRPVPSGSGFAKPGRYITLTTCTPEFTSTYRMIVWGKMVDERPRSKGKPDALVE